MKKATQINLGGQLIHIDEDAYAHLKGYLEELRSHLRGTEGCDEILADIEMRLAELLLGRLGMARKVVDLQDVEWVIKALGHPNDFATGDAQATEASSTFDSGSGSTTRRLFRDTDGIMLGGVCMGLSTYFRMDVAILRIIFVLLGLFTGFGVFLYIILWVSVPKVRNTADRLSMQGRPVTFNNIRQTVEEEAREVERRFNDPETRSRMRRGAEDIFSGLREVLVRLARVVGVVVLIGVFTVAALLAIAVWSGDLWINGTEINVMQVNGVNLIQSADWILPSDLSASQVNWAAVLMLLAPLLALLYIGLRLLVRLPSFIARGITILSFLLFIAGLILSIQIGMRMASEFRTEGRVAHTVFLPNEPSKYNLSLYSMSINPERMLHFDADEDGGSLIAYGDSIYYDHIEIEILPSVDSLTRLEWVATARGPGQRMARTRAERIRYDVRVDSLGRIELCDLLSYPLPDRFRDQHVRVILHLPLGRSIYIDPGVAPFLSPLPRPAGSEEQEVGGKTWYMSREGMVLSPESRAHSTTKNDEQRSGVVSCHSTNRASIMRALTPLFSYFCLSFRDLTFKFFNLY